MLTDNALNDMNASMEKKEWNAKVQIVFKSLRQQLNGKDCWMCDISDGTYYVAAFFVVKPQIKVEVHGFFRIVAYHSEKLPSRKFVIDEYVEDGCSDHMIGNPSLLDIVNEIVAVPAASLPEIAALYEEDACKNYDDVMVGVTTNVSVCGRLFAEATERSFTKKDGGRGLLMSFWMFHRGKCIKITTFDSQMTVHFKALRIGECVMITKFKAEAADPKYGEGSSFAAVVDRNTIFKTFAPIHLFDVVHRIDTDVMPDVEELAPRYITLVVRIDECSEVTQTRNGKNKRELTLRDGGRNSIQITLFGSNTELPFERGVFVLLGNVKVEYNEYSRAQTINISPFTSFVVMEQHLNACGDLIVGRMTSIRAGGDAASNGGLPANAPEEYGVLPPLL